MSSPATDPKNRCRLVLIALAKQLAGQDSVAVMDAALGAGDVASLILAAEDTATDLQAFCEPLVPIAQARGVAVIVAGEPRIAARVGADGVQLGQDAAAIEEAIERHSPALMIGAAGVKTRHTALNLGELEPDYLMFGAPGGDTRAEANPKWLALAEWWSAMVEIPCIALGGNAVESVNEVAATGAEFVALSHAVFAPQEAASLADGAADAVSRANRLLDETAPRFDDAES